MAERRRLGVVLPSAWLLLALAAAVSAPWLPLPDPGAQDLLATLQPPSPAHWFGTDSLGRDVFARSVLGLRVSLVVGFGAVALGLGVGGSLGLLAGFHRGALDSVVSATMAVILAFPPLILAMAIIAYAGATPAKVVLVLGILFMPACAGLVRTGTLRLVDREFVLAARASGMRDGPIVLYEILPNLLPPMLAYAMLMVAIAIVGESSLSFLGLSVPPPQPSLGGMISAERGVLVHAPWAVFAPSGVLFATVLSLNVLCDRLQRRLDRREAAL